MKKIQTILIISLGFIPLLALIFINNYYLGWLLYALSIILIASFVIAFFASGNGIPLGFIPPFLVLLYLGNMIIDNANQDDGIIVNTGLFTPEKNDYTIIDTDIIAPSKLLDKNNSSSISQLK